MRIDELVNHYSTLLAAREQLESDLRRAEERLISELEDSGISTVKTAEGHTVTRVPVVRGHFLLEKVPELLTSLKKLKEPCPLKLKATYTKELSDLGNVESFSEMHADAQSLGLECHYATFERLMKKHPDLMNFASASVSHKLRFKSD